MAFADITAAQGPTRAAHSFWARLGRAIDAHAERHSRRAEVQRLEALSDAELAARGLKRDDIIRHVFADIFYI